MGLEAATFYPENFHTFAPQFPQNTPPGSSFAPQFVQTPVCCGRRSFHRNGCHDLRARHIFCKTVSLFPLQFAARHPLRTAELHCSLPHGLALFSFINFSSHFLSGKLSHLRPTVSAEHAARFQFSAAVRAKLRRVAGAAVFTETAVGI